MVTLQKATIEDCTLIHRIQVKSFMELLRKYNDFQSNPAAESPEKILRRFQQSITDYYLILADGVTVGMLRVCNFGVKCRLSPICILPEYRGMGYSKKAIGNMEKLYPNASIWMLDTIAQEAHLCRLYESLGYRATGRTEKIQEGMDLVFYEKTMK